MNYDYEFVHDTTTHKTVSFAEGCVESGDGGLFAGVSGESCKLL